MAGYDKYPKIRIKGHDGEAFEGKAAVWKKLSSVLKTVTSYRFVLVIDCYPGVVTEKLYAEIIKPLSPNLCIFTDEEIFQSAETITERVHSRITDDRVFGQMCLETYKDLVNIENLEKCRKLIASAKGLVIIYGSGARLVTKPDLYVYADMPRWEIQQRFRKGIIRDWKCSIPTDDNLKKFKWGYFFSWRVADRHKTEYLEEIDWFLDTVNPENPKLITGSAIRDGLNQTVRKPFRVVPYFDPGVWGGRWMSKVCGLPDSDNNYAWCFDCVPEENSLIFECGEVTIEIPALDLVLYKPEQLLGPKVFARFGPEFPIRFDFLDTVDGQNLSLQVHPLVGYIQQHFGMHYTQEESYYILDADPEEDPSVFLGVKKGTTKDDLVSALKAAQETGKIFTDSRYINKVPVKKHDHILIPPGTIHCSGKGTMVLEISATPYIFTFKLWDWGRVGLDGKPRPIHISHGKENIRFERDTEFVYKELVNQVHEIVNEDNHIRERTGLHKLEFIETEREWFSQPVLCETKDSVNVLNLVEGNEITVQSPDGQFEPYTVHYAETFIIPEHVGKYLLSPESCAKRSEEAKADFGVIIARVRV